MDSMAAKRLNGSAPEVQIINRPEGKDDCDVSEGVEFTEMDGCITVPLDNRESKANTNYLMSFDVQKRGRYRVTLTGSSEMGELAQIPCTLFYSGIPIVSFTFNGTGGKDVSIERTMILGKKFSILRLNVGQNGVKLKNIRFEFTVPLEDVPEEEKFMF